MMHLGVCIMSLNSYSQDSTSIGFDLFGSDELLEMTLYFDIREFLKTRDRQEYSEARITIKLDDTDSLSENIKIRTRGIMRLTYCSFPPIMLKFSKADTGIDQKISPVNIKLVTHCIRSSIYESYVLKEYLTYKLFNLLTPYSFKTRLARIRYIDTRKPGNGFIAYGFLIENLNALAERNQAIVIENLKLSQLQMYTADMARVAVFNYMIGNTDWSVANQHNIKIIQPSGIIADKGIPVAYDFDYSGLVNTSYSLPREGIPINGVTERYYQGLCFKNEDIYPVIDEFWRLQKPILNTIRDFEYLSKVLRLKMESYISSFYKMYGSPEDIVDDLNCTCQLY